MANATLTQLIARVRTVLRDDAAVFVTDPDVTVWLNDAYTDLATRTDTIEGTFSGTTAGATLALPPTGTSVVSRPTSLRLGLAGDDDVVFVDDDVWNSWFDSGATPEFTLGRVYAHQIELYPTPTTGTAYTLRALLIPAPLAAGADVHLLPIQLERKLVLYAQAQAKLKLAEDTSAQEYLAMYEQGLPAVSIGTEQQNPGPFTLIPMAGPWDVSDGDGGPQHL